MASGSLGHYPSETGRTVALAGRRFIVDGVVQGVGFRPFVWRLAHELSLAGRVRNLAGRVEIVALGRPGDLEAFTTRLRTDAPPRARVERVTVGALAVGTEIDAGTGFVIEASVAAASAERLFPPDIATCDDCLRELFDPSDRRYRYPFINCTNCGPRATIIEDLPYDRARTSMREFPLCPACEAEYRDPADRRFHAEPVACTACGPRLSYRPTGAAAASADGEDALAATVADLLAGRIVAIKGLGGYHLACDASDPAAVSRLRDRKRRWAKPFAAMVRDLAAARSIASVGEAEAALMTSPARPIVLVAIEPERPGPATPPLTSEVTNGNRRVGLFLPYTPLHHLLLAALGRPIVLTSGNLADEPIVIDDEDALARLGGVADAFLQHDRRIRARYDDSVTRIVGGSESLIRRGRGYAPDPLDLPIETPVPILGMGAELKHTFALARRERAHIAPHTGDLEDLLVHRAFTENLAHLSRLLDLEPAWVAHDLHPEYLSTKYAVDRFPAARRIAIQHHHAHVASAAAEARLTGPYIGVAYDGLGMGDDGTLWGGEIVVADLVGYRRVARFGRAPMPGGSLAVRRPYRMALGYLFGAERFDSDPPPGGHDSAGVSAGSARSTGSDVPEELAAAFLGRLDPREVAIVRTQVARSLNAPVASSAGRLFDAVSSLLGVRDVAEYEGQAAIDLEMRAGPRGARPLPYGLVGRDGLLVYDPRPTLVAILEGAASGEPAGRLAARFHATVAELTRELCAAVHASTGLRDVCLSGGVFQNQLLAETLARGLRRDGFSVHLNHRVPANDGGISYGQAAIAAARLSAGVADSAAIWTGVADSAAYRAAMSPD